LGYVAYRLLMLVSPATQRKILTMYPTENITARVYSVYADIVRRAAHARNKTVSEYVGEIVVPHAAEDIGEELPPIPKLEKGRHKAMVAEAAKAAGMTPAQFERHAADILSARMLGLPTPDEALAPGQRAVVRQPSSERERVDIGGYAKQTGETLRPSREPVRELERAPILRRRSK
jgi:hypothetical protein